MIGSTIRNLVSNAVKFTLRNGKIHVAAKQVPRQHAQQALSIVRKNASAYGISPYKIGIMGFSPGGHLTSTASTPPTFLISTTDNGVSPENSILYYQACRHNKVPVEMHIYEKGGHGYALKKNGLGPFETWMFRMEDWMRERKIMK